MSSDGAPSCARVVVGKFRQNRPAQAVKALHARLPEITLAWSTDHITIVCNKRFSDPSFSWGAIGNATDRSLGTDYLGPAAYAEPDERPKCRLPVGVRRLVRLVCRRHGPFGS